LKEYIDASDLSFALNLIDKVELDYGNPLEITLPG
jgi:hypothetical protein